MTTWSLEFRLKVGKKLYKGTFRGKDFETMPIIFHGGSSDQSFVKYIAKLVTALFQTFLKIRGIEERDFFNRHVMMPFTIIEETRMLFNKKVEARECRCETHHSHGRDGEAGCVICNPTKA